MSGKANGGQAFPFSPPVDDTGRSAVGYPFPELGMSLRDWFAGQALTWALTQFGCETTFGFCNDPIALSYRVADAMLAERENP